MKAMKFMAVVAMCAMTLAASATKTAQAKIAISSTDGGDDALYIMENTDNSSAFEAGKDVEKIMNTGQTYNINLYAVLGGYNLSMVYTNDITNLPLTFKAGSATHYTMTFSNVYGTVKLYDAVTAQEITLANNGSYEFDCAANATLADRFVINRPAPAVPSICHYGNVLKVSGSNGMVVKVHNMDDTDAMADVTITSDDQDIDISALTADTQYKVVWNGQTLIIRK